MVIHGTGSEPKPEQTVEISGERIAALGNASVRKVSAYVEGDRKLREDIERVVGLIDSGALVKAVEGC